VLLNKKKLFFLKNFSYNEEYLNQDITNINTDLNDNIFFTNKKLIKIHKKFLNQNKHKNNKTIKFQNYLNNNLKTYSNYFAYVDFSEINKINYIFLKKKKFSYMSHMIFFLKKQLKKKYNLSLKQKINKLGLKKKLFFYKKLKIFNNIKLKNVNLFFKKINLNFKNLEVKNTSLNNYLFINKFYMESFLTKFYVQENNNKLIKNFDKNIIYFFNFRTKKVKTYRNARNIH